MRKLPYTAAQVYCSMPVMRCLTVVTLRTLSLLLVGLLVGLLAGDAARAQPVLRSLPSATQLQEDGALSAASQRPVILFFTLPGCSYCRIVRYDYLLPMLRGQTGSEQALIREVSVTGERMLTAFDGQRMSEAELARRYKVAMTPTLLLVNAQGEVIAEPLLGGDHPNYVAQLNRLLAEAGQKMGSKRVRLRGSDHRE